MVKKEEVVFKCDNCKCDGKPDYEGADAHIKVPLPIGWVNVELRQDAGMLFDGDLCDKCIKAMMKGLKKRRVEEGEE